ncbi:MAG: DUF362 domain-containing protein [Bacillota bacterium]
MDKNLANTVSINRCSSYHLQTVTKSLTELFKPWNGISYFIKPGQKILLKPNLLAATEPEEAVTTHPVIIKALAILIQGVKGIVYIGDSPGVDDLDLVFSKTGMKKVAEETNSTIIRFDHNKNKDYYINSDHQKYELASILDEMDLVINTAKLKTHPLTGLTAAVKNTYGCIVGKKKARLHVEHPMPLDFSKLVLDVYLAVKPGLSIIDAVISMEGVGPRSGNPRHTGLLMASPNAIALDRAAVEITGFSIDQVPPLVSARKRGLRGTYLNDFALKGLSLEESKIKNFNRGIAAGGSIRRLAANFPLARLRDWMKNRRPYPEIDKKQCINCGQCVKACPAQIIISGYPIPDINYDSCIRCYCCREFCPEGAIVLK